MAACNSGSMSLVWNFKTSRVDVYKCFMSLSEIERNSLSLSEFYKRRIEMRCKETIIVLKFLSWHVAYRTTNTSTSTVEWSTLNILRLTDLINCEGMVVYSVRAVGRSVVRLPAPWVNAVLLTIDKKLKSGSHCLSSPIVGTTIIMLAGDWKPWDFLTYLSWSVPR